MHGRTQLTLLLLAAALGSGCVAMHGPRDLRREVGRRTGIELDQEFGLTLNRSGLWLARAALHAAEEEDALPRGIRRLQVGVYRVVSPACREPELQDLARDLRLETLVFFDDADSDALVAVRQGEDPPAELVVIVAEREEWVLVRVQGQIDRVVEDAMRLAFDQAERPELFARAQQQREAHPAGPGRGAAGPA